jgi:phage antirepressor YoqD-like protein
VRKDAGLKAAGSDLMSRREAAKYLGIAEQTLAVWKCKKRVDIPVIRVGRLIKYRQADLDRFLNLNTVEIRPESAKPKTIASEPRAK